MLLVEYMEKNKITKEALANSLGYSLSAVSHLLRFENPVTTKFANLVELYTKGAVKAKELIKRSQQGMKKKEELFNSGKKKACETSEYRSLCKMCNKKLNEIEL